MRIYRILTLTSFVLILLVGGLQLVSAATSELDLNQNGSVSDLRSPDATVLYVNVDGAGTNDGIAPFEVFTITETKLTASDGAQGDEFGSSVSYDGNVALVGAKRDNDNGNGSGSAYIYRLNDNQWIEEAKLTPSDGGNNFGSSVSIDGDVALVGYHGDDDNGIDSGSAYIYRLDGNQWVQEAKLTPSDGARGDIFGYSVDIDANVAIVGAYEDDDNGSSSGSAYIFRWNEVEWVQEAKLTASDGIESANFGYSVSLDNNVALVGAYGDDDNGSSSGSAYIFRWNGIEWVQETKLTASDGTTSDYFGWSVSLNADVALVGAIGDDDNGISSGSAYIYNFDGSQWVQKQKLTASDGVRQDYLGRSVDIDGNIALIGALQYNDNAPSSGSAYIYRLDGNQWQEESKLLASDRASQDYFGLSASINGNIALIGARGDDDNGTDSGSVYIYDLSTLANSPQITVSPTSISVRVDEGQSSSKMLLIGNTGTNDLDWQVSGSAAWLSVAPTSGTVAPSGAEGVTVDIETTSLTAGTYTDTLTVTSNDPNEPSVEVPVEVTVTEPGSSNLLAIYALAFDNPLTSTYSLAPQFPEAMQSIVDATIEMPDKTAIVLVDLPGDGNTHIRKVHNGVEELIPGLPDADGNLSFAIDEYDMADGEALGGFLKWALSSYSNASSKTIFSYVGHGAALVPESDYQILPDSWQMLRQDPVIP